MKPFITGFLIFLSVIAHASSLPPIDVNFLRDGHRFGNWASFRGTSEKSDERFFLSMADAENDDNVFVNVMYSEYEDCVPLIRVMLQHDSPVFGDNGYAKIGRNGMYVNVDDSTVWNFKKAYYHFSGNVMMLTIAPEVALMKDILNGRKLFIKTDSIDVVFDLNGAKDSNIYSHTQCTGK